MKGMLVAVILAAVAVPVAAQQKPSVQTAAPAADAEAKPARKSRRGQDARHCLDKGSNVAIIKCAEAYR